MKNIVHVQQSICNTTVLVEHGSSMCILLFSPVLNFYWSQILNITRLALCIGPGSVYWPVSPGCMYWPVSPGCMYWPVSPGCVCIGL